MYFDPMWMIFAIPGMLLGMYAQFKLSSTYGRYIQEPTSNGMSGAEAARAILDRSGLRDMPIEMTQGHLSDHYDPRRRALFLSQENYHGRSIAAVGVAAHEAGHALQHQSHYAPLHARMALVPITNIATQAAMIFAVLGLWLMMSKLVWAAVIAYGILFLFQLVTLPVEFDASSRAKKKLLELGLVHPGEEARGVSRVLSAAAMTYVAAMISALFQMLYFVMRARGSQRG